MGRLILLPCEGLSGLVVVEVIWQFIAGVAGGLLEDWKARRENQRQVERAVAENRIRLAQDEASHNHEWEMRALEGHDKAIRRVSFLIWSAPMVWAVFDPAGVSAFFGVALAALPDWYRTGYLGITGAVWGLAELKSAGVLK